MQSLAQLGDIGQQPLKQMKRGIKWPVWAVYSAEWGTSSPVLLTMGPDVPPRYVIQGDHRNEIIFIFVSSFCALDFLYFNGFS